MFICGLCPHELFLNTKVDLGQCTKVHSDAMKAKYEEERAKGRDRHFEDNFERELRSILDDAEKKIDVKYF